MPQPPPLATTTRSLGLAATLASLAAGCTTGLTLEGGNFKCEADAECPSGERCFEGTCISTAEALERLDAGEGATGLCGSGACLEGEVCIQNVCAQACKADRDCPAGQTCGSEGGCVGAPGPGPDDTGEGSEGTPASEGPEGASGEGLEGFEGTEGGEGLEGAEGFEGIEGGEGPEGTEGFEGTEGTEGPEGAEGIEGGEGSEGIEGAEGLEGGEGSEGPEGGPACTADADCAPGFCHPATQVCVQCIVNSDCAVGSKCASGFCVEGCVTNKDCPTGEFCVSGTCEGQVCTPQPEVCDGKDNDCDNDVDEGADQTCNLGCGEGVRKCVGGQLEPCGAPTQCECVPGQTQTVTCGACGTRKLTCQANFKYDDPPCNDPGPNPCGGCVSIGAQVGSPCGECGIVECEGPDAVVCSDSGTNPCGGCEPLPETPGSPCGDCGIVTCQNINATKCTDPGSVTCKDYKTCQDVVVCDACAIPPPELCNGTDDDCTNTTPEEGHQLDCPAGEVCKGGACCKDDCPAAGTKECVGTDKFRTCGAFDADGCLEWSDPAACQAASTCLGGNCSCTPNCTGKQCGDDGCGGACGTCESGKSCLNGQCTTQCVPACTGKLCGDDGCGGVCGACPTGQKCDAANQCVNMGCADGTAEGGNGSQVFACQGPWKVAGLQHTAPACNRQAGNSLPGDGTGCNIQDLCGPGYHACDSDEEISAKGGCGTITSGFFAAREKSYKWDSSKCDGGDDNNFFGCGTSGRTPNSNCSPLNRMCTNRCQEGGGGNFNNEGWACGNSADKEYTAVTHAAGKPGGVLCCAN